MRGTIVDLPSPHPLGRTLPGIFLDDPVAQALCAGADAVLAPIISVLDNLPAYLDPAMAPDDLLPWLAHWVGIVIDPQLPPARQRELLVVAASLQGWQGTAHGIELAVEALIGADVEVLDSAGSGWSVDPDVGLPGKAGGDVVVRVVTLPGQSIDHALVESVVAAVMPAHVTHSVQIDAG